MTGIPAQVHLLNCDIHRNGMADSAGRPGNRECCLVVVGGVIGVAAAGDGKRCSSDEKSQHRDQDEALSVRRDFSTPRGE